MGDWLPSALEHKFKNYLQYSGLFTLSFPSSCQTCTSSTPCIYSLTLLCFFSIKNFKKDTNRIRRKKAYSSGLRNENVLSGTHPAQDP